MRVFAANYVDVPFGAEEVSSVADDLRQKNRALVSMITAALVFSGRVSLMGDVRMFSIKIEQELCIRVHHAAAASLFRP